MPLPARDGKSRADARIPPKRAIRRERGEMETARGKRKNEQRVKERCHARLPTNSTFPSAYGQTTKKKKKKGTHHPTRPRDPNASQAFFPRMKRANSGATRWCTAAKPTVEMSSVGRWSGRRSGRIAAAMLGLGALGMYVSCVLSVWVQRARSQSPPYDVRVVRVFVRAACG